MASNGSRNRYLLQNLISLRKSSLNIRQNTIAYEKILTCEEALRKSSFCDNIELFPEYKWVVSYTDLPTLIPDRCTSAISTSINNLIRSTNSYVRYNYALHSRK